MNRFSTLFFALTCSLLSTAQSITVSDEVNGKPIGFVLVTSLDSSVINTTSADGLISLEPYQAKDSIAFIEVGHITKILTYEQLTALPNRVVFLARKPFQLGGITVSAARWEQPKRDIPNKISTISPEEVRFQNPQTAADLLESSGDVYIQKSQLGGGSPMIRGFATNRVMLTVDGVRMNNAIFRSGNLQNVISLDPLAIENTEVVFGPGSVIYGSDAIGGVMGFYTLSPEFSSESEPSASGHAFVRGSTANRERTGHIDFNLGYKKIALLTSISYSDFEDLTMGSYGPSEYLRPEYVTRMDSVDQMVDNPRPRDQISTAYDQINIMQKIRFKPNENWDLSYGGHYSTTSDYGRYDRQIRYRGDTLRSAEWYYGPQEWMMHSVRAIHQGDNFLYEKMSATVAYQYFRESRNDRDFGSTIRTNRVERVYAPSVNLDFEQDIGERHELYYGVEGLYNLVHSRATDKNINTGINAQAQTRYPHDAQWWSASAYVSNRFRIVPKLTLLGGLRYSQIGIEAQFDTTYISLPETNLSLLTGALNGSAGLAYKPNNRWQINANLSTGFRAPNVDDIGKVFDSEPGSVVVPNNDLQSEYAYNAEIGITKIFGSFLKAEATTYYTLLDNALVRRSFQLNGQDSIQYDGELSQVQAIQNAAQATVYGIQAGFEIKFLQRLTFLTRANFQKGVEELNNGTKAPLRHAPPAFGIAQLTYERKRLMARVSSEWNSEVSNQNLAPSEQEKDYIYALDNKGRPYSPAWVNVNVRASYQVKENFLVTGAVENVFDQRYRPYSSGISAPGRNLIGSIRYSF